MLAYLALRLGKHCPREELAEAIWPEELDYEVVANRLRVALASLRRQLEPQGVPFGSVLDVSTAGRVSLREEAVWCDVNALEKALRAGQIDEASKLVIGVLLPGYQEEWIALERSRLEALTESLPQPRLIVNEGELSQPTQPEPTQRTLPPLPLYLTRFFGRQEEMARLTSMVQDSRLVTITGTGGMGKTRLAVETARQLTVRSAFVSLVDSQDVVEAILRALYIPPRANIDLNELLISRLIAFDSLLLILDNAEHLVDAVADSALRLLESVPGLKLLVTSRQRLNIQGEVTLPLSSLVTPSQEVRYEDLVGTPALAMFLDRAQHARPDFVLSFKHASAMLNICAILEGMPLALELAAARVTTQTPTQIESELRQSLSNLKSRQRGLSQRHQSLNAAIQGSYDLLPPPLREFFSQLSVFQGGWTSESASFVTECSESEQFLEDLVNRSLLVVQEDERADTLRYRFLESIRQFSVEQLAESSLTAIQERHSEYFLSLAASVSDDDIHSLVCLDAEQDNLRLALKVGQAKPASLFWNALSGALTYGHIRGEDRTSLAWAELAIDISSQVPDVETRVRLLYASYYVFSYLGNLKAIKAIGQTILQDSLENDYLPGQVRGRLVIGYAACQHRQLEDAVTQCRTALAQSRQSGVAALEWQSLRILGFTLSVQAIALTASGANAAAVLSEAESAMRECLDLLPASSSHVAFARLTLVNILRAQDREAEAYLHLKSAQHTAMNHGIYSMLIFCFRTESDIALLHKDFAYSAVLHGAFIQLRERTGYNTIDPMIDGGLPTEVLAKELGADRFHSLASIGRRTPLEELAGMTLLSHPDFACSH